MIADQTKPDDAEYFKKLLKETIENIQDKG